MQIYNSVISAESPGQSALYVYRQWGVCILEDCDEQICFLNFVKKFTEIAARIQTIPLL